MIDTKMKSLIRTKLHVEEHLTLTRIPLKFRQNVEKVIMFTILCNVQAYAKAAFYLHNQGTKKANQLLKMMLTMSFAGTLASLVSPAILNAISRLYGMVIAAVVSRLNQPPPPRLKRTTVVVGV